MVLVERRPVTLMYVVVTQTRLLIVTSKLPDGIAAARTCFRLYVQLSSAAVQYVSRCCHPGCFSVSYYNSISLILISFIPQSNRAANVRNTAVPS